MHKKSVQHAKAVEVGDPEELLEECEEHVETHLSLEAAKKAAEKDLPRDGDERLWRLSAVGHLATICAAQCGVRSSKHTTRVQG